MSCLNVVSSFKLVHRSIIWSRVIVFFNRFSIIIFHLFRTKSGPKARFVFNSSWACRLGHAWPFLLPANKHASWHAQHTRPVYAAQVPAVQACMTPFVHTHPANSQACMAHANMHRPFTRHTLQRANFPWCFDHCLSRRLRKKESSIQARVSCLFSYFGTNCLMLVFFVVSFCVLSKYAISSHFFKAYKKNIELNVIISMKIGLGIWLRIFDDGPFTSYISFRKRILRY